MSTQVRAHIALLALNLLYALSYFVVKDVSPTHIPPSAFVFVRAIGATSLFWLVAAFLPTEKVEKKDLLKLVFASLFGVVFNQLAFFHGLMHTSSQSTAIIMTTTPLISLPLSKLLLNEALTWRKVIGMSVGFSGAALIILQQELKIDATNPLWGNFLIFLNAAIFTFYLVYLKPVLSKYHLFTILKWTFLAGTIFLIPFAFEPIQTVTWNFSARVWGSIAYVVLGITFITFILNMFALRHLSPNAVTSYIFTQPVLAGILSFLIHGELPTLWDLMATVLIFVGVYFVSFRR